MLVRELQQPEATLEIARGMMTAMLCYCCVESFPPSRIQNLTVAGWLPPLLARWLGGWLSAFFF